MKIPYTWLPAAVSAAAFVTAPLAQAQLGDVLYSDDLQADTNWAVVSDGPNQIDGDGNEVWQADFGWDYTTLGIPPAPRTEEGAPPKGLRLAVNRYEPGQASAVTAILFDKSYQSQHLFTGDYAVTFDMWVNYNGPLPLGGTGSTHFATFGVGINDYTTPVQRFSGADSQGAWFSACFERGSGIDFRGFKSGTQQRADSGQYHAGEMQGPPWSEDARNGGQEYYHSVMPGGRTAPQYQIDTWPDQEGETAPGTPAFAWHQVTVKHRLIDPEQPELGARVTWEIDGLPIVTLDPAKGNSEEQVPYETEGRIFLGIFDPWSSVTDNPEVLFVVYDNLKVHELLPAPEGGYPAWAEAKLPAGQRGQDADPDGDGITNVVEYALDLDPVVPDVQGLPAGLIEESQGENYLSLTVSKNVQATDVQFSVEVSADLATWQSGLEHTTVVEETEAILKVRDKVALSAADRRFIRLKVTPVQ